MYRASNAVGSFQIDAYANDPTGVGAEHLKHAILEYFPPGSDAQPLVSLVSKGVGGLAGECKRGYFETLARYVIVCGYQTQRSLPPTIWITWEVTIFLRGNTDTIDDVEVHLRPQVP